MCLLKFSLRVLGMANLSLITLEETSAEVGILLLQELQRMSVLVRFIKTNLLGKKAMQKM